MENQPPVIVASADPHFARLLAEALPLYGAGAPLLCETAEAALAAAEKGKMAAPVLYVSPLPDMTLKDFAAALAGLDYPGPLVGLLMKGEKEGNLVPVADRFTRPVRLGALLARLGRHQAVLERDGTGQEVAFGPYRLMAEEGSLERKSDGAVIYLTEKERDILLALYRQRGRKVGRKALLEEVWGYVDGIETHTLETHIYRLRQKIEREPARPEIIETDEDGYRLGFSVI